jgi:elongation factor G
MAKFDTDHLRNIVLLSHGGAGKTSISEAMLFQAGVISRIGRTDDGTTTSDYEEEEQKRAASTQTSILPCPWRDHKVNVIDTPGYADFRGEVVSGISVAEGAVIVVAAPAGVEVGTRQLWQMAGERDLPRILFVNKMDRENVDFESVVASLVEAFGRKCVATQIPIGAEADFSGLVNLLDTDAEVPADLQDAVDAARETMVEAIAETDDDLTEKYLDGEALTAEEMTAGLKQGVASGAIIPVTFGAATEGLGAEELLDTILDLMPSPAESETAMGTVADSDEQVPLSGVVSQVFKTSADPFVGKLSYIRVYSGAFESDTQIWNANKKEAERVGQVYVVTGKDQESVSELAAGDIGAVAKLSSVVTGDTLSERGNPITLPEIEFPAPVYQMAASPKAKADLDKITSALARISEEDPSLRVTREPDTLEMLLGGLGDVHVEVAVEKMKRKFGVEIELNMPTVAYKETITSSTSAEYRHKKQSGGHGQFGHVLLTIDPLPRGSGFEFAQKVVGGSVPREFIPAVEKGCRQALAGGVLAGYPVVDIRATLFDGSYHPVDSSGLSFELAGSHALSDGIEHATPVILEPILRAAVTVPEGDTGDVMGDLNGKRARILGMTPMDGGITVIEAEVPQSEMLRYATELRSQTQGRGTFTIVFDHYDQVPGHLVQRIVDAKEKVEAEAARS